MAQRVWVVDSSAAINLREVGHGPALEVVNELVELTRRGLIAFPEQVYREVCEGATFAGLGSAFISSAWTELQHPRVVDPEVVHDVLDEDVGSRLVPPDTTNIHHADAYVVALAVQLERTGLDVTVVCDERNDRFDDRGKLVNASIPTGCAQFGIAVATMKEFLEAEGLI